VTASGLPAGAAFSFIGKSLFPSFETSRPSWFTPIEAVAGLPRARIEHIDF
jgi:hypothetical protein